MPALLHVTDFGALPEHPHTDAAPAVQAALRAARAAAGPVQLRFPPGEYHLWPDRAHGRELYVSNTVGDDARHRVKSIALLVEATDDLVIAGRAPVSSCTGSRRPSPSSTRSGCASRGSSSTSRCRRSSMPPWSARASPQAGPTD